MKYTKKQSATILIEAFITGCIMYFLPKDHWVFIGFMWYKIAVGTFGVLMLILVGILSAKDD